MARHTSLRAEETGMRYSLLRADCSSLRTRSPLHCCIIQLFLCDRHHRFRGREHYKDRMWTRRCSPALSLKPKRVSWIDRQHPYIALCITIYSGAKVLEYFVELCSTWLFSRWNNRLHRFEVEHLRTFLESYPKALERIFADITATVASQTDSYRPQTEVHEIETIVAHQSTTMRTDPYEAVES